MNPIYDFAMKSIQNNPRVINNPRSQNMLNILQNHDEKAGREFATNYCKSIGVTPEQIISQAPPIIQQLIGQMR